MSSYDLPVCLFPFFLLSLDELHPLVLQILPLVLVNMESLLYSKTLAVKLKFYFILARFQRNYIAPFSILGQLHDS